MFGTPASRRAILAVLGASGLLVTVPAAPRPAATQPAQPILDEPHLRKILKRLEDSGRTREIPAKVTAAQRTRLLGDPGGDVLAGARQRVGNGFSPR
jgi:hypothetical protein